MKRLNVMYICNDLGIGGATLSLIDTLEQMRGYVNCIVVIRQQYDIIYHLEKLNIQYYIVPFECDYGLKENNSLEKMELNFIEDYDSAKHLVEIIHNEKIDLIHINSSVSNVGAIAGLMAGIPYIWHIRELIHDHFNCCYYNEDLKRELFNKAARIISISDCVKKKVLETYKIESIRMYNGLDIDKYENVIDDKNTYNRNFLMAGIISEEKGQWDAIRAVEFLIKKGYTDIKLYIIGNANEVFKWSVEKYVKRHDLNNNIYFISFKEDLMLFRKKVSYSITGSKMEALGRSTIEAMLAGNIVIGADTGGTKELIGLEEKRGYLYEQGNYENLALVLEKVINESDAIKKRIQKSAQIYAIKEFDSVKYCKELYQVYLDAVANYQYNTEMSYAQQLTSRYEFLDKKKKSKWINNSNLLQTSKVQLAYYWIMKWLKLKQKGISLSDYLQKENIHSIAIYGMAQIGCLVFDELENTTVKIEYVMDRNDQNAMKIIKMINPEGELPKVDAIIVTVLSQEKQLIDWLKGKCSYKICGLTEIIKQLEEEDYII